MAFTSLAYAVFLPLALLAYFAVPARGRWAVLLAFSYGFYMSWHPQLILLLWLDTLAAWAGGLALGRARTRAGRGAALALGVLPCLGALFFFKYFAFAAETLAALLRPFGVSVPQPAFSLVLPLGISFTRSRRSAICSMSGAQRRRRSATWGILRCSSAFSRSWSRGPSAGRGRCCRSCARRTGRPPPALRPGCSASAPVFSKRSSLPIFSPSMPTTSLTR